MRKRAALASLLILLAVPAFAAINRDDPLVADGTLLPWFYGEEIDDIVGYAFRNGNWVPVLVQIDERVLVTYRQVYGSDPTIPEQFSTLAYADSETFTGADTDTTFDSTDEFVVMSGDLGEQRTAGTPDPDFTVDGSRVEVRGADPIDNGAAYLYLFLRELGHSEPTGTYVTYDWNWDWSACAANPKTYQSCYKLGAGNNDEDSTVTTTNENYELHFSDRWLRDEVVLDVQGGADLLDHHAVRFFDDSCGTNGEHEVAFAFQEGTFFANKSGPVRGIRSYMGASSGVLTQRDHFFYDRREDVILTLRLHLVNKGLMDFWDYSSGAINMTYQAKLEADVNPLAEVTIDGSESTAEQNLPMEPYEWEIVAGNDGTITHATFLTTNAPAVAMEQSCDDPQGASALEGGLHYADRGNVNNNTPQRPCNGDGSEYGASGQAIDGIICNTDPVGEASGVYDHLYEYELRRIIYYEDKCVGSCNTVDRATTRQLEAAKPLQATASRPGPGSPTKPKPVIISHPFAVDLRMNSGENEPFEGWGTDHEDGTLPLSAYRWELDSPGGGTAVLVSGTIGVTLSQLVPGDYTLRLVVTDSSGLSATDEIGVRVD